MKEEKSKTIKVQTRKSIKKKNGKKIQKVKKTKEQNESLIL